jgi:2-polyprenyl-6-methoxyphenol hydroxylase-like FAD-dependent oxidoreductase
VAPDNITLLELPPYSPELDDVSDRAIKHLKVDVQKVNWFSTYRVAEQWRTARRISTRPISWASSHSPAGGQGMNTGIGDAINLAWKPFGRER